MPSAHQVVGGRFTLVRPLGQGSMGSVWVAEHHTTGRQVALKLIGTELVNNREALGRFQREAMAAAQLASRHVVQVIDHDEDPVTGPFIVMELLDGETLAARLLRDNVLAPHDTARIVRQIALALTRAHRAKIIHRDLKPDNVFLATEEDDDEVVKVFDFGLAKMPLPDGMPGTKAGFMLGSLTHMSPEQTCGGPIDYRADLWALGVVTYQCFVGRLPFLESSTPKQVVAICSKQAPTPSSIRSDIPAGFDAWVARALKRSPALRFQSAAEMSAALDAIVATVPSPQASRTRALERASPDAAGFFVMANGASVGPVTGAILRRGIESGRVPGSALVWHEGWREWRCADEIRDQRAAFRPADAAALEPRAGIEAMGAPSKLPVAAQASLRRVQPEYYVAHGDITVGPVHASLLLRGVQAQKVPVEACVWREGWQKWRPIADVIDALRAVEPQGGELGAGLGLESLAPRARCDDLPPLRRS